MLSTFVRTHTVYGVAFIYGTGSLVHVVIRSIVRLKIAT